MGKRPCYVITTEVDCEGYHTTVDFITHSYPKAKEAYENIFRKRRADYFEAEGLDDDHIYDDFRPMPPKPENITERTNFASWINDDNCCWLTIRCSVAYTDKYPPGYNI
jgi:hypothetical protein